MALDRHDATYQASAMAFWLFLGLMPLTAIVGWAVTGFADEELREALTATLLTVTPEPTQELINEQLHRFVNGSEAVAPVSLVAFLWVASGGIHTAIIAIQRAQVGYTHSWIRNRVLALVFVLAFLLFVIAITAALLVAAPTFLNILHGEYARAGWIRLLRYGAAPAAALGLSLVTGVFFRYAGITEKRARRKRIWPGAIVVGVSCVAVSWMFSLYVRSMGRYPILYGSLATVALLMLWLWISSFLVLLGSELNLQMEGSRSTIVPQFGPWTNHLPLHKRRKKGPPGTVPPVAPAPAPLESLPPQSTISVNVSPNEPRTETTSDTTETSVDPNNSNESHDPYGPNAPNDSNVAHEPHGPDGSEPEHDSNTRTALLPESVNQP